MECPDCSDLFVFVSVNENACAQVEKSQHVTVKAEGPSALNAKYAQDREGI